MISTINLVSATFAIVMGLIFAGYGILFRKRHPEYKILSRNFVFLGLFFFLFGVLYLAAEMFHLSPFYPALFFFGGMIIFLIYLLIIRKKVNKERTDYLVKRLKRIDRDEKIKITDILGRKLYLKLLLKKGPDYTAKILSLTVSLVIASTLVIINYLSGTETCFLVFYFAFAFVIHWIIFYFLNRKIARKTYDKYQRLESETENWRDRA